MESTSNQLAARDKLLYDKCLSALQTNDRSLAALYAGECSELRKIAKITMHSQLALERIVLRLETVEEFGDIAYLMAPVRGIVSKVKTQLEGVLPEISLQLGEVDESLQSIVGEIGEATEAASETDALSEEARKILAEANMVAEQRMKDRFPEIPAIPTHEARIQ